MFVLNTPSPDPKLIVKLFVVGSGVVFQQTPLDVMTEPPLSIISPETVAELEVIFDTAVIIVGTTFGGSFSHPLITISRKKDKIRIKVQKKE